MANINVTPGTGKTVCTTTINGFEYQNVILTDAAGLQAGAAVVGKVTIDQTTPGTTNAVVVSAAPIPSINSSSAYAHTAVTTAYATGQLWANNATAGSVTFGTVSVAKANNQAFSIIGATLSKSGNSVTNAIFRVHLFSVAPTTAVADLGAFAGNITAAIGNYIGYIDFNTNQQLAANAQGIGLLPASNLSGLPVSGAQTVYFVVEVRGAYTPLSAEALTLTLVTQ